MPLSGLGDDSLEGWGAALSGLSVGAPGGKEKAKGAVDMGVEEEDPGEEHHPSDEVPFDTNLLRAHQEPLTTLQNTLQQPLHSQPHIQAASSATTTPPMAEDLGFTGMPYPTYGVTPVATAPPMASAVSEPVTPSSTYTGIHEDAPLRYAESYHRTPAGPYQDQPLLYPFHHFLSLLWSCSSPGSA